MIHLIFSLTTRSLIHHSFRVNDDFKQKMYNANESKFQYKTYPLTTNCTRKGSSIMTIFSMKTNYAISQHENLVGQFELLQFDSLIRKVCHIFFMYKKMNIEIMIQK